MPDFSTTTWTVIAVSLGLFILLAIAYTVQTIERNNRERRRLESALKIRAREFIDLLEGPPPTLLGRDLRLLICQGLEDVYRQLQGLGSKHAAELEQLQVRSEAIRAEPEQSPYQPLTNPVQIKDTQRLLKQLHAYITRLRGNNRLNAAQAQAHVRRLRHLLVLTSLDGYQLAMQQAQKDDKPRLVVHYLRLSLERMQKNNPGGVFNARIEQTHARIAALENEDGEPPRQPAETSGKAPLDEAWKEFGEDEESWKKKSLYD